MSLSRDLMALMLIGTLLGCGDDEETTNDHPEHDDDDDGAGGFGGTSGGSTITSSSSSGGSTSSSGGTGSGGSGGSGSSGGTTGAFSPTEGRWLITDGVVMRDTCAYDDVPQEGDDVGFDLTLVSDAVFRVQLDDSLDSVRCDLTDQRFMCESVEASERVAGYDITIEITSDLGGAFDSNTEMTMQFDIIIDCQGNDCWAAELKSGIQFPCDVSFEALAEAR